MIFVYSLGIYLYDVTVKYLTIIAKQYYNFKQNIEHNRLEKKELSERKIGGIKSKIGSSLQLTSLPLKSIHASYQVIYLQ